MPVDGRWYLPDYLRYAREYCGEFADDFDLDAIAEELRNRCEGVTPDATFDEEEFIELLKRYDISGH